MTSEKVNLIVPRYTSFAEYLRKLDFHLLPRFLALEGRGLR
jgi:hypothetical protein